MDEIFADVYWMAQKVNRYPESSKIRVKTCQ